MKKLGRKLTLSRETIRDLSDSQLREAAGARTPPCPQRETEGGCGGSVATEICQTDGNTGCVTCGCC